jgi:signal transduction histidine kinase
MIPTAAGASSQDQDMVVQKTADRKTVTHSSRSALAQLLHALNQPLTGLQCSMEVALACPRSTEQYVHGLREGLELTERMRALVDAMREIAEIADDQTPQSETTELAGLLREGVEDLRRVAAGKNVRIALDFADASLFLLRVRGQRPALARSVFRLLDSTLSMAAPGTVLRIEAGSGTSQAGLSQVWIRFRWQADAPQLTFSRPELGLLIAQAWLERVGAEWDREATDDFETLTVRLARVS